MGGCEVWTDCEDSGGESEMEEQDNFASVSGLAPLFSYFPELVPLIPVSFSQLILIQEKVFVGLLCNYLKYLSSCNKNRT